MTVGDVTHKKSSTALRNTWRLYEPTDKHDIAVDYWMSNDADQLHRPDTTCTIGTKHRDTNMLISTMTASPIGMNVKLHSTQGQSVRFQHQLGDCLRRVGILESAIRLNVSHNQHLHNYLVDDTKTVLRRSLLSKLMSPFKYSITRENFFERGYKCSSIAAISDCSLRTFQAIVEDIEHRCSNSSEAHPQDIEYIPSRLSIINPAQSVPSFHVLFKSFKQVCDYFYIRDINDRQQCLTRVDSSSSNTPLLRVLGTMLHKEETPGLFYFIGCDMSFHPSF